MLQWNWSGFTYMPNAYEYSFAAKFAADLILAKIRASRNAAQTQPTKQSYQQCMSNWNNTAAGQVVSFFSLLNVFRHPFEWFGIGGAKMAGIHLLDKAEQSTDVTDYSITAGTSAEPAVLDGSSLLGVAGAYGLAAATAADAAGRFGCHVQDPNMLSLGSPILPVFP